MPRYILVKTGPDRGRAYEIGDAPLTIGRDRSQTIHILDQGVSRSHSEIFRVGNAVFVRDLGSTNGTFLNGQRILEERLRANDEILIGNTILVASETPTLPEETPKVPEPEPTVQIPVPTPMGPGTTVGPPRELVSEQSRNLIAIRETGKILEADRLGSDAAIEGALEHLVKVLNADEGYLFRVDRARGTLRPRAVARPAGETGPPQVSRAIVNHALRTRHPVLTSDARMDERFRFSESIVLRGIRSVICVPVVSAGRADGALYLHRSEGPPFTSEDAELAAHVALQIAGVLESRRVESRLPRALDGLARVMMLSVDAIHPSGRGHSTRVADLCQSLAMGMSLPTVEIHRLRLAAHLHDIGKLVLVGQGAAAETPAGEIPMGDAGDLSGPQHIYEAEKLLQGFEGGEEILPAIRYHHERADGSGYPYGIRNEETPVPARILIVANAFDNACEFQAGRPLRPFDEVVRQFTAQAGAQFDPEVVRSLQEALRNDTLYHPPPLLPAE